MKPVTKLVSLDVPEEKMLAALGEVALRHEHMNHVLRLMVKSLANVTLAEAVAATERKSPSQLRQLVKSLARKRLGVGGPLIKLQAILATCGTLTDKRNRLVHRLWAKDKHGEAQIPYAVGDRSPVPTVKELRALARAIKTHTNQMIADRREGWLHDALSKNARSIML
jgi:hypothetical protein